MCGQYYFGCLSNSMPIWILEPDEMAMPGIQVWYAALRTKQDFISVKQIYYLVEKYLFYLDPLKQSTLLMASPSTILLNPFWFPLSFLVQDVGVIVSINGIITNHHN